MPQLDAKALEIDPDGCAFLRSILSPTLPKNPQFARGPSLLRSSVVAHLGRELTNAYEGLLLEGVPNHLADAVERYEAAVALRGHPSA
jgi:hypothetical protein